jgi:hypothetical protein
MHAIVAERDGALIGLAHYLYHRNTIQVAATCYMQDLFTGGSGEGTGSRPRADRCGDTGGGQEVAVHLLAYHETNAVAMKLYDSVAKKTGAIVYRKMVQ